MPRININVDDGFLRALSIASSGKEISYKVFYDMGCLPAVGDLVSVGYLTKEKIDNDNANYKITPKGKEYFDKALKYTLENLELLEFGKTLKL